MSTRFRFPEAAAVQSLSYHILRRTSPPSRRRPACGHQKKTRTSRPGFRGSARQWTRAFSSEAETGSRKENASKQSLGDRPDAGTHQADTVEIGLLAGVLLGAFAGLIALIQQLDFLEFLESLGQQAFGIFELDP
jgi:hypothetical protein